MITPAKQQAGMLAASTHPKKTWADVLADFKGPLHFYRLLFFAFRPHHCLHIECGSIELSQGSMWRGWVGGCECLRGFRRESTVTPLG